MEPSQTDAEKALIDQLTAAAAKGSVPMPVALSVAGISPATWDRWKSGRSSPTMRLYIKLQRAIRKLAIT